MNDKLNAITEACQFLLQNYPNAQSTQNYIDSRINKNTQGIFQFGYFPNMENINCIISILGKDYLKDLGILYTKEIEDCLYPRTINFSYFEDYSVIIPYKDSYGNIVGLVGRTLLSEDERHLKEISKYKNSLGFPKTNYIFGLFENKTSILKKDCVFLVEGQLDVIKAYEKGFDNVLGIGSASLSMHQFSLIKRYTNNIFLLLDNDEAGLKGRKRIMDKFSSHANIQNFYIPQQYKDIDEYLSVVSFEEMELNYQD